MRWPFWDATSADQSTCKATIQPFHSDVCRMGSCTALLEPLLFSMHAMTGTEYPPELFENHDVMLFINRHFLSNIILKQKLVLEIPRTQSSCCWHGLIERSGLHQWTTHSKENLFFFNLAFEPLAHLNTFCHVILCESLFDLDSVWVKLKVILQDSVNGWTRKTQLLRGSPDSAQQNRSLRRHALGILQSTFCHLLISVLFWWTLSMFLCPWTSLPSE